MAGRKKSFRKYFDKEENFTKFHKMAHKLLEAPTEGIAHMIQAHICVREGVASSLMV